MHRYGKGGDSAETNLQEVSQSLQSTLVMMRANKEKDANKNIRLRLLPIVHFLAAQNTHKHFKGLQRTDQCLLLKSKTSDTQTNTGLTEHNEGSVY